MTPCNLAHYGSGGRGFFGTVAVGARGQVSIPAQARKSLGLESGDQLVALTDPSRGLALTPLSALVSQYANTSPIAALVCNTMAGTAPPKADSGPVDAAPVSRYPPTASSEEVMITPAVRATDIIKRYGDLTAVNGVSLEIHPGEISGIIGPNGAGKTTLMECLEGLCRPTSGTIDVLGENPSHPSIRWRGRIGIQLQTAALPSKITANKAMIPFASMCSNPVDPAQLPNEFGVAAKGRSYVDKLSGGQCQRVFIVLTLLGEPEVMLLDELATALDPQARLAMWAIIRSIRQGGATVVMTTHYMEEAEALCDRAVVIDAGRLIAFDTVPGPIASIAKGTRVQLRTFQQLTRGTIDEVDGISDVMVAGTFVPMLRSGSGIPQAAIAAIEATGLTVIDIHTSSPDLEDAFLALTGRSIRQEA